MPLKRNSLHTNAERDDAVMTSITSSQLLFNNPTILVHVLIHLSFYNLFKVQAVSKIFKETTELPELDLVMFRGARPGREGELLDNVLGGNNLKKYEFHPILKRCRHTFDIDTPIEARASRTFEAWSRARSNDAATSPPLKRLGVVCEWSEGVSIFMPVLENERGVTIGQVLKQAKKMLRRDTYVSQPF
jgi:hypothetical protein